MNAEIFAALKQLERERGIPTDYMVDKITQALTAAYKKNCEGYKENIHVVLGEEGIQMYAQKEVVDDVLSPMTEITLEAAREIEPTAQLGDLVIFKTFHDAFYWATITLSTVGYGDLSPVSEVGKTLSIISSLIGIGVIALPSSIITAGYMQELNRRMKEENSDLETEMREDTKEITQ